MEDRRFRALLRELGLRPPASEQESFWRIPATLTPQQLRRAAASLAHHSPNPEGLPQHPEGLPQHPEGLPAPPRHPQAPAPGEDLGRGRRDQAGGAGAASEPLFTCPAAERPPAPLGSDSESEEPVRVPLQSGSKRRRQLDSEDEDGGSPEAEAAPPVPRSEDDDDDDPQPAGRRKRARRLEEEEEEEEED
ncbi:protein timeless homolog [Oxyura jamaicensis]|uniref:protein timeless homolog n=1 Tax=Oxyura jamaicensis TaxID=8884 RepID=UPI0015A608F8|nr:protein timeless homolog [Oxyura jamaicensis]